MYVRAHTHRGLGVGSIEEINYLESGHCFEIQGLILCWHNSIGFARAVIWLVLELAFTSWTACRKGHHERHRLFWRGRSVH